MNYKTLRFGVGETTTRRSCEWLVLWDAARCEVYAMTRTFGEVCKVSVHRTGRCHVRNAHLGVWLKEQVPRPPVFVQEWEVDTGALASTAFEIVIPESELRIADWKRHKDRGTIWLPLAVGEVMTIAIMFSRKVEDAAVELQAMGWRAPLVQVPFSDGRSMIVVPGSRRDNITQARHTVSSLRRHFDDKRQSNPRGIVSVFENGRHKFLEIAGMPEADLFPRFGTRHGLGLPRSWLAATGATSNPCTSPSKELAPSFHSLGLLPRDIG